MFNMSEAYFLAYMALNLSPVDAPLLYTPRMYYERNTYYRTLDDCLIAASAQEKQFRKIHNIGHIPVFTDVRCTTENPNKHR